MRQFSEGERRLCAEQARIFEASAEASECGSAVFVRRYMNSGLAKRLDGQSLPLEQTTPAQLVAEVDEEFGKPYGSERYERNELHWMGYLYRYWCCSTGQSSKAVYRCVGARELRKLYGPYHTLDAAQAVERIIESRGLETRRADIEYAVAKLRDIRARRAPRDP